ncbi:ATP phosphoribosyltransferase regulatory subunit [Oceanobacillus halotolerans]|uniref:ATP phosphoribosyltransferase regulatory subunit n=1 Tax=Oceanobacillus halotolerans TaxID=2663380 RepID=UPI0013DCD4A6|nr:ATP phosphoribosyltransferase regulatory subunit [Oceanobacillus halotolerans]
MQSYIFNNAKDTNVEDFQIRDYMITTVKERFSTYGYKQVRTSTFEYYDLYSSMMGTVHPDEMIKVMDPTGKVLVLRPDVTIPITRMNALHNHNSNTERRFFYVLDVFRQSTEHAADKENTQAGVEYFGKGTPEIDAEILKLASHTLDDFGFSNFKLEIGHAGFFKELIAQHLSVHDLGKVQTLIKTKNIAELEPFLDKLSLDNNLKKAILAIPFLYGKPQFVIEKAKEIVQNKKMQQELQNLIDVYRVLQAYGVEDYCVFDLGLINHMDYYTGIVFQGFIEDVGKPVLMGGRYNQLAAEFGTDIPAIGFAFHIDTLVDTLKQQGLCKSSTENSETMIYYDQTKQQDALKAANQLRNNGFTIITSCIESEDSQQNTSGIYFNKEENIYMVSNKTYTFSNPDELIKLIQNEEEEV